MNPRTPTLVARVLLVAAIALIAYLATTDRAYPLLEDIPDKLNHALAFGALALLTDFSFPSGRFGAAKFLAVLGYGALIELVQFLLPHRQASLLDLAADAAGIAAYAVAMPFLLRAPGLRGLAALRGRP